MIIKSQYDPTMLRILYDFNKNTYQNSEDEHVDKSSLLHGEALFVTC